MMIKKYANILPINVFNGKVKINTPSIEISDDVDTKDKSVIQSYFDAALSRAIVDEKSKEARFVTIKENNELVYFVYDSNNFKKETNFDKFNSLIQSQSNKHTDGIDIYGGNCVCTYDPKFQSIRVYPKSEVSILSSEFKLF